MSLCGHWAYSNACETKWRDNWTPARQEISLGEPVPAPTFITVSTRQSLHRRPDAAGQTKPLPDHQSPLDTSWIFPGHQAGIWLRPGPPGANSGKFVLKTGGEGGIRTRDALRHTGFRDRRIRPLCHLSRSAPQNILLDQGFQGHAPALCPGYAQVGLLAGGLPAIVAEGLINSIDEPQVPSSRVWRFTSITWSANDPSRNCRKIKGMGS